jgi:DNA-binding LacI/PurR family transcriptional regulator
MDPTIKDVARLAGVSTKTVSNVINNNSGRYSGETRDRVLDAIKKLNYRPNRAAQYMRSGVIGILAFAIPDIGNPYFSEIAREIIDAAKEQGYTVLIEHTAGLAENERLLLGGARSHAVDGVILDPVEMTEDEIYRANTAIPIVMLGERVIGKFYDHVMIDNVAAARLLTEHLLKLGHRRIAILPVSDTGRDSLHRMRYQGYLEALRAAGIQPDPELIVATSYPMLLTHQSGMAGMEYLLARGPLPDAVFCLNDLAAFGAMKVLSQHGCRVPEDIAVAGFDDIAQSYFMSPALTTIAPDKKAIGRLAVSLLMERIQGQRTGPPEMFTPDFRLIVRESTVGRVEAHA